MDECRKTKRKIPKRLVTIGIVIALIPVSLIWNHIKAPVEPEIIRNSEATTSLITTNKTGTVPELIPVYLVGAVARPGIYHVEQGSYLYELVELAGGLLEIAAADSINLVMRIDDSQLIKIPTNDEVDTNPAAAWLGDSPVSSPMIDINKADMALLERLPGIGPTTAQAIVDYRSKNGPFQCVEDLMKVSGIKESRFEKVKDLIVAG